MCFVVKSSCCLNMLPVWDNIITIKQNDLEVQISKVTSKDEPADVNLNIFFNSGRQTGCSIIMSFPSVILRNEKRQTSIPLVSFIWVNTTCSFYKLHSKETVGYMRQTELIRSLSHILYFLYTFFISFASFGFSWASGRIRIRTTQLHKWTKQERLLWDKWDFVFLLESFSRLEFKVSSTL